MPKQQKQWSYAEWMTRLFKKFSKEMDYIKKNTTDHERAQMSRANAVGSPNDKMSLRDIYNEMWKLDTKYNKEETVGAAHEKRDNNGRRMTKEDWDRWDDNEEQMKNERTGVYAQVTEEFTQEEYDQWRLSIRQPEQPIQTENTELREWIRVMFELPREDMCYWRKVHNQVEEFTHMPTPKTQIKKEVVKDVKVKQPKKIPEQKKEESFEEWMDKFFKRFGKVIEECDKKMSDSERQQIGRMIEDFKKLNEPQDTTSEGSKEIEFKKDQSVLLPENNNNETNDEYVEMKTEKRHHRKIIKTREEVEMMKNGLTNVFSVPMTNHAERMNFMERRRTPVSYTHLDVYKRQVIICCPSSLKF